MKWAEPAFTSAIIYKVSKLMYTGSPCVILYEKTVFPNRYRFGKTVFFVSTEPAQFTHTRFDGRMKHLVFEIDVFRGRGNETPIRPADDADAACIQSERLQHVFFGWRDMRNASMAAVSQKQDKAVLIRIDGKMVARKSAQPDRATAHPMRNFAEPL